MRRMRGDRRRRIAYVLVGVLVVCTVVMVAYLMTTPTWNAQPLNLGKK